MDDLPLEPLQLLARSLARCDSDTAAREFLWQLLEEILDGNPTAQRTLIEAIDRRGSIVNRWNAMPRARDVQV